MKFIVSSTQLLKRLQVLGGVINSNNTLPVLDNFLFELNENRLKITSSDLETTMSALVDVESTDEISIVVNAKLLLETLKTFPNQPLIFKINSEHTLEIVSEAGKYDMAYFSGDEFPEFVELPSPSTITIPSHILLKAIDKTLFATGNDELRPILNGILFEFSQQEINFVATDAHKLVKYTRTDLTAEGSAKFIAPKKPLQILRNALIDAKDNSIIEFNEKNVIFTFNKFRLTCLLIEGKYPDYNMVIPKENPNKLTIDRASFLNSVRRVSIFSSKTTHQIQLKMAGTELNISAEDIDYSNKADERLTCHYQGDDMQIGFNSRYLTEILNNLNSTEILLEMSFPNKPGLITPIDNTDNGEQITMLITTIMAK